MDRHQAAILLKELIENNLTKSSFVSLEQKSSGNFELILLDEDDSGDIRRFVENKNLAFKADIQKGYCIIYKPK